MNAYADKKKENKSQSIANNVAQKRGDAKSTFRLVDNRPEAVIQRKQQEMMNNSDKASHLKAASSPVNASNGVIQMILIKDAVRGKKYKVNGKTVTLKDITSQGWLTFNGIEGNYRAKDVDEINEDAAEDDSSSDDSSSSDYSSDIGEYSQAEADDAAATAAAAPRGIAGQKIRNEQMDRLRHKRGGTALAQAAEVAVGERTARQSTFVQGTDDAGGHHYAATSSSAPFETWAGQKPFVVRNEFGDGSHIHGEAGLIYHITQEEINLKHVAVHKPICPVCAAVLSAYGISYNEANVREEFPATWGNPFDKDADPENWNKVNDAATGAVGGAGANTRII